MDQGLLQALRMYQQQQHYLYAFNSSQRWTAQLKREIGLKIVTKWVHRISSFFIVEGSSSWAHASTELLTQTFQNFQNSETFFSQIHSFTINSPRKYISTVRWSNFDRLDPKMGVFLQSTEATPCGHLLT